MNRKFVNWSLIYGLFVCFAFSNCGGKSVQLEETSIIENEGMFVISPVFDVDMPLVLDDYLDSLKYVKLELTDESLVGNVTRLEVFEERIYILDCRTTSLFVFSIEGKYLFKIHEIGGGPGEFINLRSFHLDRNKRRIYLTDWMYNNIIQYDLGGNYISQVKIPFQIGGILPLSDETYFIHSTYQNNKTKLAQEFNMFYTDSAFNLTKGYFPYHSKLLGKAANRLSSTEKGSFYFYDNSFYIFDGYNPTVFEVETGELISHIYFNLNNLGFNTEYLQKDPDTLNEYLDRDSFCKVWDCYENDNFIIYTLVDSFRFWKGIYSKRTGTNIFFPPSFNRYDGINLSIHAEYDSWLITDVSAEALLVAKENYWKINNHSDKFVHVMEELFKDFDIEDNPVLVFYKLKDL